MPSWRSRCEASSIRCGDIQQPAGEVGDVAVERGREQQRLPRGGRRGRDGLDVLDEAHVEHAVGFVEHQHFDAGEIETAAVQQVEQATGCGDQHVQRAANGLQLGAVGHAADDGRRAQPLERAPVGFAGFRDLERQLAGGREHQHARAAAGHGTLLGSDEALQRRQHEGGGLAAAGRGRNHEIHAGDGHRDRLRLDGRGLGVARVLDGLQQSVVQAEGSEGRRRGRDRNVVIQRDGNVVTQVSLQQFDGAAGGRIAVKSHPGATASPPTRGLHECRRLKSEPMKSAFFPLSEGTGRWSIPNARPARIRGFVRRGKRICHSVAVGYNPTRPEERCNGVPRQAQVSEPRSLTRDHAHG